MKLVRLDMPVPHIVSLSVVRQRGLNSSGQLQDLQDPKGGAATNPPHECKPFRARRWARRHHQVVTIHDSTIFLAWRDWPSQQNVWCVPQIVHASFGHAGRARLSWVSGILRPTQTAAILTLWARLCSYSPSFAGAVGSLSARRTRLYLVIPACAHRPAEPHKPSRRLAPLAANAPLQASGR